MRTLAIETASEACSLALFDMGQLIAYDHQVLGRGHAEALIPMIAALPEKGKSPKVLVSLGPGSFTGVRIGIATARALGFAWNAEVLGYPTLALIAAQASERAGGAVTVCVNGGHGEWFVQNFANGHAQDNVQSLTPDAALAACKHETIAGNRAQELAALLPGKAAFPTLPDARSVSLLPESAFSTSLTPIYGRAPDAKPQKLIAQ